MNERDEPLTNEQQANLDKLYIFYKSNETIHITLNRKTNSGNRYFYNGTIKTIHSNNIFELEDLKTKEILIFSILELKDGGVFKYTDDIY